MKTISIPVGMLGFYHRVKHMICADCDSVYLWPRKKCDHCGAKLKRIVVPEKFKIKLV